ncbi:tetratricopeptide repeat protein 1-like isoform X2 [Haliotis rubra]|nr:tetratricopeptide repeat protein 1-like isoform X2 [Haliotis rubra]XP_046567124.1 tetratricopeptide repeat protein 1-like isoform X2 [Haliotis rubra]
MSKEKGDDLETSLTGSCVEMEGEQCCEDEADDSVDLLAQGDTNSQNNQRIQEFIDIHGNSDGIGTPVEESGEVCKRTGGATVAEISDRLSDQRIESDDEYMSADDGSDVEFDDVCCGGENIAVHEGGERGSGDGNAEGAQGDGSEVEELDEEKEKKEIDDEECRRKVEESLSDDEKLEQKNKAQEVKEKGNQAFREGSYKEAIRLYTEALHICPLSFLRERSIMFSNKAACQMKLDDNKDAIRSCSKALELHPHYMKALLRRAELYERTDKLDEALADFQKAVELDPSQHAARHSAVRLADQIKERNEKLKTEMLGKLKDLGNMILKPFGMSTDNFNLQQDPSSGSYSVQFQQNQPKQ